VRILICGADSPAHIEDLHAALREVWRHLDHEG
jgi:hypothetical protein